MHIYGEKSHDKIKREVEGLKRVINLVEQSLQKIPVRKPNLMVVGQEEADLISYQKQKQMEAIKNSVAPDVIDLNAIARSKKESDIRNVGPAFFGLMETLCTKFDAKEIKPELVAFMYPDPLGLKAEALHKIADIL